MSVNAINWALDKKVKRSGAKFVLLLLCNYADDRGYCYPGQVKLAKLASMSQRAVSAHLAYLEELKLIRRERRHRDDGKRTSDGYWLAYVTEDTNKSNGTGGSNTPPAESATYKNRPVARTTANTKDSKDEPSVKVLEAQPPASPPRADSAVANSEYVEGITYLRERYGPIPDPAAQGAAIKWLLQHYTLEQCCACLDALLGEDWRKARVSWLTVKKEIGSWMSRRERRNEHGGRPQPGSRSNQLPTGERRPTRLERIERIYSERDYERLADEGL
jgi:DNA-binding transcriptional ArsR family regulator